MRQFRIGAWEYMPEAAAVGHSMYTECDLYGVELVRIDDEAKLGNWLKHLSGKPWWLRGDADDLMAMLDVLDACGVIVFRCSNAAANRCAAWGCIDDAAVRGLCKEHAEQETKSRS